MLSYEKQEEVKEQLEKFTTDSFYVWKDMLKKASACGALSEEMRQQGNHLLAKAIVDIWCRKRPYAPLDKNTKREFDNLEHFI